MLVARVRCDAVVGVSDAISAGSAGSEGVQGLTQG